MELIYKNLCCSNKLINGKQENKRFNGKGWI